jgi:hypothetical protein
MGLRFGDEPRLRRRTQPGKTGRAKKKLSYTNLIG